MPTIARRVAALLLFALLIPGATLAADEPRLAGAVTDQTGVLAGTSGTTGPAIDRLKREHNVDLWVLYVRTTGATPVTTYAQAVASVNSLGVNDVLLVVAMDDRTDALWVSDGLPQITDAKIDQILSTQVEPRLAAGDPAGAIVGAAAGLGEAAGPIVTATSTAAPTAAATVAASPAASGTPSGSSGSGGLGILPIVVVVAAVGGGVLFVRRRRAPKGAVHVAGPAPAGSAADVERHGNSLLIETDDAVRDADQELGFVEAQFGAAEAANFRPAQQQAADELRAAFIARQKLDDATPDSSAQRTALLAEIVQRCEHAKALLAEQATRIAALRDVEKTAPDLLAGLPAQIAAARARLATAQTTMSGLNAFAPGTWQTVTGDVPEAGKRLDFADGASARATAALAAGDTGTAASSLRQAQTALAEAGTLFDAIANLSSSLTAARDRLPALLASADTAIASARQAIAAAAATSSADLAGRLADAERLLAGARALAGVAAPDVLAAERDATAAAAAAEGVLSSANAQINRSAERAALLLSATGAASASIGRASDFIATRRGAVGMVSRTRLAEAQRQLADSGTMATVNPDASLTAAQRAQEIANEALQLAGDEFAAYERTGAVGAGATAVSAGSSASADLAGGGWGGTGWGTPTPPGGFPDGVGTGWGGLRGRVRGGRW